MTYSGAKAERFIKANLTKVVVDLSGWEILYRCVGDGTFWLKTYPQSELHGGGPPRLERVSRSVANEVCERAGGQRE